MFVHTCSVTGIKRKFASGRDAKKWLKEQQARYVPDYVPSEVGPTKGVGFTVNRRKPLPRCKTWAAN